MPTAVFGTGIFGTDTYGAGGTLALRAGGKAVLLWQSAGVDVPVCVDNAAPATVSLQWADGWYQHATVTCRLDGATVPAALTRPAIATLRQVDTGGPFAGPFGRYRLAGGLGPGRAVDHAPKTELLAYDWLWAPLQRVYTTAGVVGVNPLVALIQIVDMLRGALGGPIAPSTDAVTWANTVFSTATWYATWEGCIAVFLYWLTGSAAGAEWLTLEGSLGNLDLAMGPIVPRTDQVSGQVLPRWDWWAKMLYDPGTTWYTLLTELCAPKRPGRTSFGLPPLTLSQGADGVYHLRREGERWTQGWGWKASADTAHVVGQILPLKLPWTARPVEPQYDHVVVTMAFLQVSTNPIICVGEARAFTDWYTWDPDFERLLVDNLSLGGIVGASNSANPNADSITAANQYCQQIADATLTRALGEAWLIQPFQLAWAWYWPELGQDIAVYDPPAVSDVMTLAQATIPFDGSGASFQLKWRAAG